MRICVSAGLASVFLTVAIGTASARTLFVNNRIGSDKNDATSPQVVGEVSGPVRSISRALQLAGRGDIIDIRNTGVPYYETLALVGRRTSGSALRPFEIVGNGAVLTGAMSLPPSAWQPVGTDLWKIVPYRKGHYQLVRDGKALTEVTLSESEKRVRLPKLPVDQWCVLKGAIYFQAERNVEPDQQNFAIARHDCGITIMNAHDVRISGLVIRHFRLDGIQLCDDAESIRIQNVALSENGRAGLVVRGTSVARVTQTAVRGNRRFSILIEDFGGVDLKNSDLDADPTVR